MNPTFFACNTHVSVKIRFYSVVPPMPFDKIKVAPSQKRLGTTDLDALYFAVHLYQYVYSMLYKHLYKMPLAV